MKDTVYVPPIKIQGIKTKLVPLIKQSVVMDKNSVWIEPFMGSGIVGFNVEPHYAIFADTNPHIIEFYNQIKKGIITPYIVRDFLEREGKLLEQGDDEYYYTVRTRFNQEHNPLDFLFLNRSCFNGMIRFNKNYHFNVPYGHKPQRFAKAYVTKIVNQVAHVSELFQKYDWSFICQSFEETISMAKKMTLFIVTHRILAGTSIIMIVGMSKQKFRCIKHWLIVMRDLCFLHGTTMTIGKMSILL